MTMGPGKVRTTPRGGFGWRWMGFIGRTWLVGARYDQMAHAWFVHAGPATWLAWRTPV
jgi:hypothetical protein